jgi:hypothetical protein
MKIFIGWDHSLLLLKFLVLDIMNYTCTLQLAQYKQSEIFIILKKPHKSWQLIILQNC